jgi:hypothetical protein
MLLFLLLSTLAQKLVKHLPPQSATMIREFAPASGGVPAGFPSLPVKEFAMQKKNPLLAGLLNMLVPGSGYWYVDQDRARFIKTLIVGIAAIAALIVAGSIFQNITGFAVSQGACTGILLLIVLVPLFLKGQQAATQHNFALDNASTYTARQHGDDAAQLAKNQNLRDKGYISEQEFDSRKDRIESKK